MMDVNIIVAAGSDGAIGRDGQLIWNLPGDLKRFKQLTMGHPVIMGRKTWESLPKRPLPGRQNIVITRNKDYEALGADIATSVEEALSLAANDTPFIIGGAEIYNAFMPFATKIYLTEVDADTPDADAWLQLALDETWIETERSEDFLTPTSLPYRFRTLKKNHKLSV